MTRINLLIFLALLNGCITVYKDKIDTQSINSTSEIPIYDIEIGDEITFQEHGQYSQVAKMPEASKKIIKEATLNRITNDCANFRDLRKIEISFEKEVILDNTCWVFTLCYLVWPGMLTGKQNLILKINDKNKSVFITTISYRSYAHLLLAPALIFKPLDDREMQSKIKLIEMFSEKFCTKDELTTFLLTNQDSNGKN